MFLRCAVLVFCLNFVNTEVINSGKGAFSDVDDVFSLWPSIHNGVRLMRLRKREVEPPKPELTTTTLKPIQSLDQSAGKPLEQVPAQKPAPEQVPAQEPAKPLSEASANTSGQSATPPLVPNKIDSASINNTNAKGEHPDTDDIKGIFHLILMLYSLFLLGKIISIFKS